RLGDHLGYYCGRVWVSPHDPNEVVTSGVLLLRSKDGGRTFTETADTAHSDHHAYWFDPSNPARQFNGNDGGMYATGNGGDNWRHWNNLAVGQFTTIAVDNKTPYNIYGGLQDNGTMKGPATRGFRSGWTSIGGGDGSAIAVDPRDGGDLVYIASQFGSHSALNQKTNERWSARAQGQRLRYNWISPLIVSSHHPDIVYLGSQKVHRSMNSARGYTDISDDITRNVPNGDVPHSTIKDLSESPLQFGLLYAGCDDGSVKMTPDGGFQWIDISTPQPKKWVSRIVASKWDKPTVYCAQSGYREDDFSAYLWKSTDFGKTWKSIVGNLPAETINVIREDPARKDVLYVGTDLGVYVSFDGGTAWETLHGGLMTTPVHDLVVQPRENELVIASHARSVWVLPLALVHELTPELRSTDLKLWPLVEMRRSRTWGYNYAGGEWSSTDQNVPPLKITFWTKTAGPTTIRIKDAKGAIVKEMKVTALKGYNFADFSLLLTPGKPGTALITKPKTGAEAVKDPYESERPKFLEAGDYTVEIEVGGKTTGGSWKLTQGT
ncbi:MAG: glycosyl hydrolase, partial [Chlorobia bacterium]|nr:glycosyl hydrolase [Fimbriimonadaceae bacterium]